MSKTRVSTPPRALIRSVRGKKFKAPLGVPRAGALACNGECPRHCPPLTFGDLARKDSVLSPLPGPRRQRGPTRVVVPRRFQGESPEARLINLFNAYYARIFKAAAAKDRDAARRLDLESHFSGSAGLAGLFCGVELDTAGRISRTRVLSNLAALKVKHNREGELLCMGLSELLDFLLFSTMESLDRHAERYLQQRVSTLMRASRA